MLYQHDYKKCFADSIGDRGIDLASYFSVLEETSVALDALRKAYDDNSIPMLNLPEATLDIEDLKPIVERCRRDFDTMIILGDEAKMSGCYGTACSR